MKKIIAMAIAAACFVSASFALDFEVGVKGILGTNVADGSSAKDTIQGLTADSEFQFGGAAYANFALFGGLGVQVEPTIINSSVKFEGANMQTTQEYDALMLDVPVMAWLNLDLWRLTVGFGAGVDYSMELSREGTAADKIKSAGANLKDNWSDMSSVGFICGADGKFYVTDHIGIVASVRYIMDFTKKEVPVIVGDYDTGASYPTIEYGRRFLYGGIGAEFKLF